MDKSASFVKLPPLIPTKEVNKISKFFKKNNQPTKKKDTKKLYAQVSSSTTNTREVLKIKETFPNLQAKIENIQKIINSKGKSKLRINMTTKDLFRKQIIIFIITNELLTGYDA